jgi:competence protein ComEA
MTRKEATMEGQAWWRSPRLVGAAACFALGAALLAATFIPRWATAAPPPAVADEPFGELGPLGPEPPEAAVSAADAQRLPGPEVEAAPELVVYVTGAVLAPDVYRLPAGARVKDAVTAAGGLSPDAAGERVNLAGPLSDAQHVHVPFFAELAAQGGAATEATEGEGGQPGGDDGLIDLNRAGASELEELPGVGPTLAGRIVARREEHGPFGSVEELHEVTGVGAKLFAQIAPLVTVGP